MIAKKPRKIKLIICTILTLFLVQRSSFGSGTNWVKIAPHMDYTYIPLTHIAGAGKLHAFKFDLNNYQLNLVFAQEQMQLASSVQTIGKFHKALIAINGGFFSPELQPIGLRLRQQKTIAPMKDISWWGVFYVENDQAKIINSSAYQSNENIQFALQAGPRLIINGHIPRLKPGYAARSAVCISTDNKIILASTENARITTSQLAKLLRKTAANGGLGCYSALNLDGGSSAQFYANFPNFKLYVANFSPVTDAIIVKERSSINS